MITSYFMRASNYSSMNIFNENQIKEINNAIKLNFVEGKDDFAVDSHKTSDVKFIYLGKNHYFLLLLTCSDFFLRFFNFSIDSFVNS